MALAALHRARVAQELFERRVPVQLSLAETERGAQIGPSSGAFSATGTPPAIRKDAGPPRSVSTSPNRRPH